MNTINGYPIIYRPEHPRCNRDGYIYEHTEVAENKLQRLLKPGEVVHHRDLNKNNNNPNNLIVFSTKSDHTSFHRHNCNETLLKQNTDETYTVNYLKSNICPKCFKEKDTHAKLCINCYQKQGAYNRIVNPEKLTRDKLKELIRKESFTKIGKDNGVTDNAIKKWCDFYNLPRTKKEINSYTDKEWEKI